MKEISNSARSGINGNSPAEKSSSEQTPSSRNRLSVVMALLFVLLTVGLGSLLAGRLLLVLAGMGRFAIILLILGVFLLFFCHSKRSADSTATRETSTPEDH